MDPIDRLYEPGYVSYDPLVADIYASVADNRPQAPVTGEIRGMQIDLPAGSELLFPVEDAGDRTLFGDSTLSHPLYYGVQLSIPRVAHDTTLRLPLFVNGISGTGTVEIGGQSYEIGSSGLDARFGREAEVPAPDSARAFRLLVGDALVLRPAGFFELGAAGRVRRLLPRAGKGARRDGLCELVGGARAASRCWS